MVSDELSSEPIEVVAEPAAAGMRLDAFLAAHFSAYSRVQLRRAINAAAVSVDGGKAKAAFRLRGGERISIRLPQQTHDRPEPEAIPLDVLYEDDWLIAINKPPQMVVHPSKGHWSGTLTAALAYHFDRLSQIGGATRPGIVHRLDRDTSGVIVIAKSDQTHLAISAQFEHRTVEKEYLAIVCGCPDCDRDIIEQPIGIHPHQRDKMAIRSGHATSRDARSFYEVQQRFAGFAAVRVTPKTGRTHQIRLHLAHIGCPVLCDKLYGGRARLTRGELIDGRESGEVLLDRQALHACRLRLTHPQTQQPIEFRAPLPADMVNILEALAKYRPRT